MKYKVGDTIVHWTYGLGNVVAIDRKDIAGVTQQYYVIEAELLKIWVPVEEAGVSSIRLPTEKSQFGELFEILQSPGVALPDHQFQRKNELRDRIQKRTLGELCHVVRDLTDRSRQHPLNQNDLFVLSRAQDHLIDEWALSLETERSIVVQELEVLLQADRVGSSDQPA
jgi:RNA polymerase-interacting CarD/CdnL/TRCF family regulator